MFSSEMVDDIYEWNVFDRYFDAVSELLKDIKKWEEQIGQDYIQLNFHFNNMFPFKHN